ncbi:hypothetical protein W02_06180 [Nitrospira sp. KM1]|nr:hypothetical protein W02_06180 [Nitrospira sp. KM1]
MERAEASILAATDWPSLAGASGQGVVIRYTCRALGSSRPYQHMNQSSVESLIYQTGIPVLDGYLIRMGSDEQVREPTLLKS